MEAIILHLKEYYARKLYLPLEVLSYRTKTFFSDIMHDITLLGIHINSRTTSAKVRLAEKFNRTLIYNFSEEFVFKGNVDIV